MKEHSELFIGLDVSKLKTSVALAEDGRDGEVRFFGDIDASPASIAALATKLAKRGARLHFCYEAGPTGYDLYRQIIALGHDCAVVAPSLIPQRPGDSGQDQPARRAEPGQAPSSRRTDAGLGP